MADCTQPRRWLTRRSTLNMATGQTTPIGSEWNEGPCGKPLFDARSKALGKCPACEAGWTHPENYPVNIGAERNATVAEPLRSIVNSFSAGAGR